MRGRVLAVLVVGWIAIACASTAGPESKHPPAKPTIAGAWRATQNGSSRVLLLEPDGQYREHGGMGPVTILAAGRWTTAGSVLQLRQESHSTVMMGETRKESVQGPSDLQIKSLEADAVTLDEHRYQRISVDEARALFPAEPTAAQAAARESKELVALRATVDRLKQASVTAQTSTSDLTRGLAHNDALREARRKAAELDAPDVLREAIALKKIGASGVDSCGELAEALYAACNSGSLRALEVLIQAGLGACGMITEDAIREARAAGQEEAAKLLELGAKAGPGAALRSPSIQGEGAPASAAQATPEQQRGVAGLLKAAQSGDYMMAKAWLDQGIDVNAFDGASQMRRTPLHIAVQLGNEPLVKLLVARGANIHATDARGQTALQLAERDHPALVPLLSGEAAPGIETVLPAAQAKVDFSKDPALLDPGALINPNAPPPKKAVEAEPAAAQAPASRAPSAPKPKQKYYPPAPPGPRNDVDRAMCAWLRRVIADTRSGKNHAELGMSATERAEHLADLEERDRRYCNF